MSSLAPFDVALDKIVNNDAHFVADKTLKLEYTTIIDVITIDISAITSIFKTNTKIGHVQVNISKLIEMLSEPKDRLWGCKSFNIEIPIIKHGKQQETIGECHVEILVQFLNYPTEPRAKKEPFVDENFHSMYELIIKSALASEGDDKTSYFSDCETWILQAFEKFFGVYSTFGKI